MIDNLEPGWLWMIGGILLLIAEIIAPGFFLVFIGVAALATGAFTLLFGMPLAFQLILFTIYALVAVMIGRKVYANQAADSSDPLLNDRVARMVGKSVTVEATQLMGTLGGIGELAREAFGAGGDKVSAAPRVKSEIKASRGAPPSVPGAPRIEG